MTASPPRSGALLEEQLVRDHLGLVRATVAEMAARMPRHAARDDLHSAGMIGLVQAARSFDPSRGVPFHRYAATRIKGALLDEMRAQDWASRPVRSRARQLEQARDRLTASLRRSPTDDELASALGVEKATVRALAQDLHRAVVLNFDTLLSVGEGDGLPAGPDDPEEALLNRERRAYLNDAVNALPPRLRTVIVGYFFEDRCMQDIGVELGVSESRVSQLRAEAVDLLRDGMNSQLDPAAVAQHPVRGRVARRKAAYYAAIAASSSAGDRLSEPVGGRRQPVCA